MTRNRHIGRCAGAALLFFFGIACGDPAVAAAANDHPMFSRFPGSEIIESRQLQYSRSQVATGFPDKKNPTEPTKRAFEGKTTTIIYQAVGPYSALEVIRNYEQAFARAGLKPLLSCFNETCGNMLSIALFRGTDKEPLYRRMLYDSIDSTTSDFGYVSATGGVKGAPFAASVFVGRIRTMDRVYVGLDIVEGRPMQLDQIVVDLDKLTNDLREQGKVVLAGIYFDTDKDVVKPESEKALRAITEYLQKNPKQTFFVVGHSDTTGSYEHNVDLSRRRAQAVVAALISKYAAAKSRLTAVGIGPVAPAGSNANEDGRAGNRRVELVLR